MMMMIMIIPEYTYRDAKYRKPPPPNELKGKVIEKESEKRDKKPDLARVL